MSLLSETVGTVLQTSEPIVYSALSTPVDPNVVTLASAVYEVPTSGLAVNTNVQVPLNIAIPPGSVITNVFVDCLARFVAPPGTDVGLGIEAPDDYYVGGAEFNPWAIDTFTNFFNTVAITTNVSAVLIRATNGSVSSGKAAIKILYV